VIHSSAEVSRGVSSLPFDVAADARYLLRLDVAAVEQRIERGTQILAGDWLIVARPCAIELSAIDELAVAVEEIELRRARGEIGFRSFLRLVD
jgi:hypothetical protein